MKHFEKFNNKYLANIWDNLSTIVIQIQDDNKST